MKELVEKYIKLRDAKAQLTKQHKDKVARIDEVMDQIEVALLEQFDANGIDSVKSEAGTAYTTTRVSANVADWDAVLSYIRENDLWSLLERRVSKDAVKQFREENDDLPPGVNWSEEKVINIRRSA